MKLKIEVKSDTVNSYWFGEYPSGIKHLLIDTVNKWEDYHRMSNDTYDINGYILHIPEIPWFSQHLCTKMQEKDQISFYWIPYELITETRKIKE